jgi:SpoVK/Ycf46/Vps4 family AAA+-type ATPase
MKQNIYFRLFKTIKGKPTDDIVKVAYKIIDEERKSGHTKLAQKLEETLEPNISTKNHNSSSGSFTLNSLPMSRRQNTPLATTIDRENLRHHMILSSEIEDRLLRIEKEYIARERLAHNGLKPRQKILLYGPPGCGKSMGAERIAWNIGLPFLKIRFEAVISSYLGESANNLRMLFESIKNYPCVLLLDEFDFIAKSRTYGQDVGEMYRLVNMMLYLLDEYNAPGLLIATTNLEGALDKALFRRFDEVLYIEKPGFHEIPLLLKDALSSMRLSSDIKYLTLTRKMKGFSAAQIVKVAQDAAKIAIISNQKVIHQAHLTTALNEALEKINK